MIDFRLVQAASVVAEELNISRAAARLHLSQSTISKQIMTLEDRVGVLLFHRDRQHVELTDAGRAFLVDGRDAILYLERAVQAARAAAAGAGAIVNLGKSPYADPFLVSTALSVRLPHFSQLKVNLSSNFSNELIHQILAGILDLAIVVGVPESPKLSSVRVAKSPFFIGMANNDPLAKRRELHLTDLDRRNWILFERYVNPSIYDNVERASKADNVVPSDIQHVASAEEASYLIANGKGLAFLTQMGAWRIARDGITMRPLKDPRLTLTTCIVARANEKSRVVGEFLKATVAKLEELSNPTLKYRSLPGSSECRTGVVRRRYQGAAG